MELNKIEWELLVKSSNAAKRAAQAIIDFQRISPALETAIAQLREMVATSWGDDTQFSNVFDSFFAADDDVMAIQPQNNAEAKDRHEAFKALSDAYYWARTAQQMISKRTGR